MPTLCPRDLCTGCAACFNACGVGAISLRPDEEGFLHPEVDPAKCIQCGHCAAVCPQLNPADVPRDRKTVWACWNKDETIRKDSTSGGAFSAFALSVLKRGGVVCGAAFDPFPRVRHISIEHEKDLSRFRGSKYVQSEIGTAFSDIREHLRNGRTVLFSGTPCQVAGLYGFLGTRHEGRLFTIDLACAGVPSPAVFASYVSWLERKYESRINEYGFRNKRLGWHLHETSIVFSDGKKQNQRPLDNPFYNGFLKHLFLRPSCSRCPFANPNHPADITMADFWGYEGWADIDRDDGLGVSAVIVNSANGQKLFDDASRKLESFHRTLADVVRGNQALQTPSCPSPRRNCFWAEYLQRGFDETIVKKFLATPPPEARRGPTGLKHRIKRLLKAALGEAFCHHAKSAVQSVLRPPKTAARRFRRLVRQRLFDRIALWRDVRKHPHVFVFVSPGHTNLGDNAQTLCIKEFLEKHYPGRRIKFFTNDYIRETNLAIIPFVKRISRPTDPVFLHSGYRMTDVWPGPEQMHRCVVTTFTDRPVVSFPQTINYVSAAAREIAKRDFNSHPNHTLMCRDAVSFKTAEALFPNCRNLLVPDVVMSKIGQYRFPGPRSGILVCKRNDQESNVAPDEFARIVAELSRIDEVTVSDTSAKDSWKTMHEDLRGYLENVWNEYAKYRLVVTDRYHGTIFALIASTPVLVFPSTDHKVRSGLDWFPESFSDYVRFVPNPTDVPAAAEAMFGKNLNHILPPFFRERFFDAAFEACFPGK